MARRIALLFAGLLLIACRAEPPQTQPDTEPQAEQAEDEHNDQAEPLSERVRRISPRRHINKRR